MADVMRPTDDAASSIETSLKTADLSKQQGGQQQIDQGQGDLPRITSSSLENTEDTVMKMVGPSGDTEGNFDILQFQNSFYECIEELRIRRSIDSDNEEKINQLVSTQHDQQRTIKEEISKHAALSERHSQEICEIRRQHDEKIHQLEADKTKLALAVDSWEKETKELKDEIRTLQLTKHSLEKMIKDQDQRLQLQGSARSSHLSKMTELEALGKDVQQRCSGVAEQLKRLQVNVSEATKLNSRLTFINHHQTCASDSLKVDLKAKTEEIISLRAQLDGRLDRDQDEVKAMISQQEHMEQQVKQKEATCRDLLKQLDDARTSNQSSLEALAKSQQLSERHLASANQSSKLADSLSDDIINLKRDISQLSEDLLKKDSDLQTERETAEKLCAESQLKEENLRKHLESEQASNQMLVQAREKLEELNASLTQKNDEMNESSRELKEKLGDFERREQEKPKTESRGTDPYEAQLQQDAENPAGQTEQSAMPELESNLEAAKLSEVSLKEDKDETLQEKNDEVSEASEGPSDNARNDKTAATDQVPITTQPDQPEATGVIDKESAAGNLKSSEAEVIGSKDPSLRGVTKEAAICPVAPGVDISNKSESESTLIAETSKESVEFKELKEGEAQMAKQKQGNPCETTSSKEEPKDDGISLRSSTSLSTETQQIIMKGSPPFERDTPIQDRVDVEKPKSQVAPQGTASPEVNLISANHQITSFKISEPHQAVSPDGVAIKPNSQPASLKEANLPDTSKDTSKDPHVNSKKQINQLDPSTSQSTTNEGIQEEIVKQDSNEKSIKNNTEKVSAEQTSKVEETKSQVAFQPSSSKDIEKLKSTQYRSGLSVIKHVGPAGSSLNQDINVSTSSLPSSFSASWLKAFSRTGTKPSYILPGFSLLTAQPRRGTGADIRTSSILPPSTSPQSTEQPAGVIPTSAGSLQTLSKTPSQGKPQRCLSPTDDVPSTKGNDNSQEWPNFAKEFDSGPSPSSLCIDYSKSIPAKPTPAKSTPRITTLPVVGSKRSAAGEASLFSDEEDDDGDIKEGVASQINRIQRFLRSDRLKRPRRTSSTSKDPVA